MTKTELNKLQLKAILQAVKENLDVIQDSEDTVVHG